jgi:hypothetical protein
MPQKKNIATNVQESQLQNIMHLNMVNVNQSIN